MTEMTQSCTSTTLDKKDKTGASVQESVKITRLNPSLFGGGKCQSRASTYQTSKQSIDLSEFKWAIQIDDANVTSNRELI